MTTDRDGLRTVLAPADPSRRRQFLEETAAALLGAPGGTTVLVEQTLPVRRTVVVLPPALHLRSTAEVDPSADSRGRRPPPPARWRSANRDLGRVYDLVPDRVATIRARGPRELLRLHLSTRRPIAWVQTIWVAGDPRLGGAWVARRVAFRHDRGSTAGPETAAARRAFEEEWSARVGSFATLVPGRLGSASDWANAGRHAIPSRSWTAVSLDGLLRTVEPEWTTDDLSSGCHAVLLGATGAGKTWQLAEAAAREVGRGGVLLAVDLHGDLGPAITTRLGSDARRRVVAIDVARPGVVGIAALAGGDDRAAGHLVAAVRRLSPDGEQLYWGFRLERVFDAFVRLVQESGGSLLDLYALLTDADRRDVARLATRRPELARFLDELGPIVRRSPDFLWPAAARLSKVALLRDLAAFLAPTDGGIDLEHLLLVERRSVIVRVPFSRLGYEAASFAASLVLGRAYYGLLSAIRSERPASVLAVLDEAHALSPRLVAEMLTDGRKFGVRLMLASQFPDRFAPELRLAAAASAESVRVFRSSPASASAAGKWLGLPPTDAERLLPALPTGVALRRSARTGELLAEPALRPERSIDDGWGEAVAATREEFLAPNDGPIPLEPDDPVDDAILLSILGAEEEGGPADDGAIGIAVDRQLGRTVDPAELADRLRSLERRKEGERVAGRWRLTGAGARRLGLTTSTGAVRETATHRWLLVHAFRIFARRGHRLEIVRQGRFDTTLPDARLRQLPGGPSRSPRELAAALERARTRWAWRYFAGRDVHVEAEVSGALRSDRIRRGLAKGLRHDAYVLFLVVSGRQARTIRRTIAAAGVGRDRAGVWVLPADLGSRAVAPE